MRKHQTIIFTCLFISVFMFSFSFALVPLYNVFCKATGLNGKITLVADTVSTDVLTLDRQIRVEFVTTNHANLPWDFYPEQSSMNVYPGQNVTMIFIAKNKSDHTMTVQAIPSLAPGPAVLYFHKIECFCFEKQTLAAGDSKRMTVVFRIDAKIPKEMQTVSLSYTLFDVTQTQGVSHEFKKI